MIGRIIPWQCSWLRQDIHGSKMHIIHHYIADYDLTHRTIASSINMEFRDVNKFISELGGSTVVVTDSWIIQCNLRTIDVLQQRDAVLKYVAVP